MAPSPSNSSEPAGTTTSFAALSTAWRHVPYAIALEVQDCLNQRLSFKVYFMLASASRLNLVARFLAEITAKQIRHGSYSSVDDGANVIYDYLLQHIVKPKSFVWRKTAERSLARERRARDALDHVTGNR